MDDNIACIDENPITALEPFDPDILAAHLTERLQKMVSDSRHVTMRTTRSDDHIIADRRSSANVDGDNGFCFGVFETGQSRVEGLGHESCFVHPDR